ncbi:hypothetical protein QL285_088255 [Trifolium repens]|nr:hypothetical protein QL285_088255 [Trifolium repens]
MALARKIIKAFVLDYVVDVHTYRHGHHVRLRRWCAKLSSPSCEHKSITNDSFKKSSCESKQNTQIFSPKKQRKDNANVLRHVSKKKKKKVFYLATAKVRDAIFILLI